MKNLQELYLQSNLFTSAGAAALGTLLKANETIQVFLLLFYFYLIAYLFRLSLRRNVIINGDIFEALKSNRTLITLDMHETRLSFAAFDLLTTAITMNDVLQACCLWFIWTSILQYCSFCLLQMLE